MLRVKRERRMIYIQNENVIGSWSEIGTFVYLTLFGLKVKTIHSYFISYMGNFCDLKKGWKFH